MDTALRRERLRLASFLILSVTSRDGHFFNHFNFQVFIFIHCGPCALIKAENIWGAQLVTVQYLLLSVVVFSPFLHSLFVCLQVSVISSAWQLDELQAKGGGWGGANTSIFSICTEVPI